jgi:two-component system phosphate regulon sensor histidine kinase PhoR
MKTRLYFGILWPFILIFIVSLLAFFVLFPSLQNSVIESALETGGPVSTLPLFALMFFILGIALIVGFAINAFYTDQTLVVVDQLVKATKELGEGHYKDIKFPKTAGNLPVVRQLTEEMRKASMKTEANMNALKKEQDMLSAVLANMTDGIMIIDQSGKTLMLNTAAEKLFNVRQEDFVDRPVEELFKNRELMELWQESKDGEPKSLPIELESSSKYLQVFGTSLDRDLPGRSMLLFQDLTDAQLLENVRRDFISNVSHELRTPVAGLKVISETLLDGALDDPVVALKFVKLIDSEVDNLALMVNELLELSRIEAGVTNFDIKPYKVCEILKKVVGRMALQAERAGVNLTESCPAKLPRILADPDRLAQVFINLIHNAIKFTSVGGHIDLTAWQENDVVIFRVTDDGDGISCKDIDRIFERFYKADRARTSGGTGLGLSISKHIVEEHGGKMWVESKRNVGSSFYFSIPIAHDLD